MTSDGKLRKIMQAASIPGVAMLVMAFFGGYAVLGPNGLLAYGDYSRQLDRRQAELDVLKARREEMRNRVALLDPRHADPDMVDELVRKELNVAHPDEVIIPLS